MKILTVTPPDPWIDRNILPALDHYASRLVTFRYHGYSSLWDEQWRTRRDVLNRELVEQVRALQRSHGLDLIFMIVLDDFLLVNTARQLRDLKVPTVNYHVDMVGQWYRVTRTAQFFDVVAAAQPDNMDALRRYGCRVIRMPMAANPDFYHKRAARATGYRHQVSFIGTGKGFRYAVLAHLADKGFPLAVYGTHWRESDHASIPRRGSSRYKLLYDLRYYGLTRLRQEGPKSLADVLKRRLSTTEGSKTLPDETIRGRAPDEQLPALFRSSVVNLGFSDYAWSSSNLASAHGRVQSRLRDFEVPLSGGFYLAQYAPEHEDYYEIGEEIESWSSVEELVDKVDFYLGNPRRAEAVRERGQKRALRDHTWRSRFDRLFLTLADEGVLL